MKDFKCNNCGKCCLRGGACLQADEEDRKRWNHEWRDDILQYEDIGDLWIGEEGELDRCPFLRKLPNKLKYKCLINDTKPNICREYPFDDEQMAYFDCEGLR